MVGCSGRWWIRTTAPAKSYDARCPFTGLYLPCMFVVSRLGFYLKPAGRRGWLVVRSTKLLIG